MMANSNQESDSDLENSIDLAITTENYPNSKITLEQLQLIGNYILGAIDRIGFHNNVSPKFNDATLRDGVVHIYCVDMETANWLCPKIQDKSLWSNEKLQICVANDLPQYIKIKFQAPGFNGNPNEILKQFESENRGLSIKLWKIIFAKNKIEGQDQLIWIDTDSYVYLKRNKSLVSGKIKKVVFENVKNIMERKEEKEYYKNEGVNLKRDAECCKELLDLTAGRFGFNPNIFL